MSIRWSVVITTRNRAAMLQRAIRSCVEQTLPCEIVVIDEASEDNTPLVVKGMPNLTYIRNQRPLGHSAAANHGIREASGEWIKPLDDDDWLTPDCLEKMTAAVDEARAHGFSPVIVSGAVIHVDEHGRETGRSRPMLDAVTALRSREQLQLMMVDQAPIGTPVQVGHSREAALNTGGWSEHRLFQHQHGDEVECWIKLVSQGDTVYLPSFIAYRTLWSGGSQALPPLVRYESNVYLKDLIAAHLGEQTSQKIRSYLALHWALIAIKERQFSQAIKLGLEWMKQPSSLELYLSRRQWREARRIVKPLAGSSCPPVAT